MIGLYVFREDWLAVGDLFRERSTEEAIAKGRQIVDANAGDSGEWLTFAYKLENAGFRQLAIETAFRSLKMTEDELDKYVFPCLLLVRAGNYAHALDTAVRGLKAKGGSLALRSMKTDELTFLAARSLYELGNLEEAKALASSLNPVFAMAVPKTELMMTRNVLLAAISKSMKRKGRLGP